MQLPVDFAPLLITLIACLLWFVARATAGREAGESSRAPLSNPGKKIQRELGNGFQAVRLDRSSLCLDCQTVNESAGDTCYVCGASGSLLSLARVLDGHFATALPKASADSPRTRELRIVQENYARR